MEGYMVHGSGAISIPYGFPDGDPCGSDGSNGSDGSVRERNRNSD
jgi:hypothetical protein